MGRLRLNQYLGICSSMSPVTTSQMAEMLGVDRRSAFNIILSGRLPTTCFVYDERSWHKVPLEVVVFLRKFRGLGNGRPWGSRKYWEHGYDDFLYWYEEQKAEGWRAEFVNGEWIVMRPQGICSGSPSGVFIRGS